MAQIDPVIFRELPVIQKIIDDETWLEAERRGCPVSPQDPVVRENVCQIVLRIGALLRASITAQLARRNVPAMLPAPCDQHHAA